MTNSNDARTMVYVSNADSGEIYVLRLNELDGSLHVIERVEVNGSVKPLAISPDSNYLYASITSQPYSLSSFAINRDSGTLRLINTIPLPERMAYISTDRTGRYLFGASYWGSLITINRIGREGEVDPEPIRVIASGKSPHCIRTDPSNKFLFVTNLGADIIQQYRFNQLSGAVEPNDPASVSTKRNAGPRHFAFHPHRAFVYCTNELDGTLNTYILEASGSLTILNSHSILPESFSGKPWAADIHLTPDGRFLFASERSSSTIAAFTIDNDNGALYLIDHYPTETQPRGFSIDPQGRYLLAAGEKSNRISCYQIDERSGTLKKLSQVQVGRNPTWVEMVKL